YLNVAKKRRSSKKQRQKAIKKQLQYLKRNLAHIEGLLAVEAKLPCLSSQKYKMLLVVNEVYRQQLFMYENSLSRVDDRIVSLTQPHVRPIIRGKAGSSVEFGAKLSASCYEGYVFLDRISWDNFNESSDLKVQVEAFKIATGNYPESVHVDQIYRNKENRKWCKERGIRISGPPLGRPAKNISTETKKQAQLDERDRNCIEGKFGEPARCGGSPRCSDWRTRKGEAKRRYSLDRMMTKLSNTSETGIAITFLVMNLSALLRRIIMTFFVSICRKYCVFPIFRFGLLENIMFTQIDSYNELCFHLEALLTDSWSGLNMTFSASPI
ncbi:transposase, partial [Brunnivagina elsteri]|uniref:transposase n=1 Tax=Brunnivagina elsteri TaxID=1247191 RepID=UPI001FEBD27D